MAYEDPVDTSKGSSAQVHDPNGIDNNKDRYKEDNPITLESLTIGIHEATDSDLLEEVEYSNPVDTRKGSSAQAVNPDKSEKRE